MLRSRTTLALLLVAACNRTAPTAPAPSPDAGSAASLSAVVAPSPPLVRPTQPRPEAAPPLDPTNVSVLANRVKIAATDPRALALLLMAADESKVTYGQLKKNASRFKGTAWAFAGRVLQITEDNGISVARLALDYYGSQVVLVSAFGESPFVEGDAVDVLGVVSGSESYVSQAGWNITLPSVIATGLLKRGELAKLRKVIKDAQRKAQAAGAVP